MTKTQSLRDRISGHGDVMEIAKITGFNSSYVRKVLNGQRKNALIVKVALDLVAMREKIYQKYKNAKTDVI